MGGVSSGAANSGGGNVSDEEILSAIRRKTEEKGVPPKTKEVADAIGYSKEGGRKRLIRLKEDGFVDSVEVGGGGAYLWRLEYDEEDILDALSRLDQLVSAEQVANELGADENVARTWLRLLEREDKVDSIPAGEDRKWSEYEE